MTEQHRNGESRADEPRATEGLRPALAELGVAVVSIVLGFLLLELPWSNGPFVMGVEYIALNLMTLALLFATVYLVGQRTRVAAAAFVGACLLAGIANAFVVLFKGQPIVPSDLFALSTAASVSGGYSYWPTLRMLCCIGLFALYCVALWKVPLPARTRGSCGERWARIGCNVAAGALVAVAAVGLYAGTDIHEEAECTVDVWDVRGSYSNQGTALCFLERMQELTPTAPEGYSPALADELRAAEAHRASATGLDGIQQAAYDAASDDELVRPHVIVIMDETFSDLSAYPGLEGTALATPLVSGLIAEDAIGGSTVVSALGGSTCNSEFEFLTGSTTGNMGGGVYPYVLYDMGGVDSVVGRFVDLGYDTHAIHPAEGSNWSRSRVYEQLGFDTFDDIETFKADPDYEEGLFRELVSDRTTYDLILSMLDKADGPQFFFDVTIQNHGGYETSLVPEGRRVTVDAGALSSAELDEFASCMAASEDDLTYLLSQLQHRDEPVVVCFFGDHQPGFADELFEATYGTSVEGVPLAQVQERFSTPYLIWGNDAARALGMADRTQVHGGTTSLNYLGTMLLEACGLPTGEYLGFLSALRDEVPAINMNGYMASNGLWYWFDQDGGVGDALRAYEMVQYRNLFG